MRLRLSIPVPSLLLAATLAAGPALAQSQPSTQPSPRPAARSTNGLGEPPTGQRPLDLGPNTPEANKAYMGGGVVLQGAPGAPAPMPEPTPPGQTPRHAVP